MDLPHEPAPHRGAAGADLATALSRLAESEALLDALFSTAPVGLGLFDTEFRFVRVNARLAEMNGLSPADHVGKTPRELLPGLPMDDVEAAWRKVLATGEPLVGMEVSGETPARPGARRFWREDWYPVRVAGRIIGIGAVVRETTEERRAEELRRLLVGIVGHDLRTPLSVITTTAHLLVRAEGGDERTVRLGRRVLTAAGSIEALARDLLDYAVVQSNGALAVSPAAASLARVVRAAAEDVWAAHPDFRLALDGRDDVRGTWDVNRLRQLVGNLLGNAVKFSPPEAPTEVRWWSEGGDALLTIRNHGPAIPPERLETIFEPGAQGTAGQARGGIGLGLFIAREIVRAHGGSIRIASTPADGTTVTVRLPVSGPRGEP